MFETMHWEKGRLILLDQTRLPLDEVFIQCENYRRIIEAIKKLEVRGAPAIGAAAAFAMVLGAKESAKNPDFLGTLSKIKNEIISARPTAVNLGWGAEKIYCLALKLEEDSVPLPEILESLENLAVKIYNDDIAVNMKIGKNGADLLPNNAVILTHCNAGSLATCGYGTALGVVRAAWEAGKVKMVYADETRPLLQGARLTAFELTRENIPVTVITDGMAAWIIHSKGVNAVITGADRIAANGDIANKIGTYGIALAAKAHKVPFYIAAPISTFDFNIASGRDIPIEERPGEEVRCFRSEITTPSDAAVFNPAFDVTPADLITGIITEYGVILNPTVEKIRMLQKEVH
ncbi:MAG: S-methyl-5-thioribose-1-phosphate isomerase [Phascolarctobacterium sp.]|nr:S-methyl-5-thioribose-1-phosphate isomerase [Phascolarctobacterium sp.]MCD8175505.1 S-methyl-5-thioribose-1-phosphate isomerase [Phascolarctobacterium sp.]